MKKLFVLLALVIPSVLFAQSKDEEKQLTKFEQYSSVTGKIVKFQDSNLPTLQLYLGGIAKTSIRTILGDENKYFYRIEKPETSSSIAKIAMIEYSDLVNINNALKTLVESQAGDISANPDYLENKFRTEDGLEVGYYVSNGKVNWFIKLERYSSSTIFPKNEQVVIDAFANAQSKIEELMKKN